MRKSPIERIHEKIDRSGGEDACWPWRGYLCGGYPALYFDGKTRKVHIYILELRSGEHADGRDACHDCDNPPCCNHRHLHWGTPLSNAQERDSRGRRVAPKGEAHGCAKLSAETVRLIRARHMPRHPKNGASALAREFGVHTSTVHLIVHDRLWA